MKDYRKFCRPKTIKNPSAGDYEITLNCGNKVYVEKHEFERKLDKFFKNYQVVADHDYSKDYLTTVALENGTISFNIWKYMGTEYITSISYSTDGGDTWTTTNNVNNKEEHLTISVDVSEGDKVLWKGDAQQLGYYDDYYSFDYFGSFFSSDSEFNVQGNVMSMLYGDDFVGEETFEYGAEFAHLFNDYDGNYECLVVSAEHMVLPATTLASSCYSSMFNGCTSLTTAPELSATTLADNCYSSMFGSCTSLTTAPVLSATTLANSCYSYMFSDCTGLTTAPTTLPATTLTPMCYYGMFQNCTNLTTAPELPATTLVSKCYNNMFRDCTSLNYIKCLATDISATDCTLNWVDGVASSGTFVKNDSATWDVTGASGVPSGWTVETESGYKYVDLGLPSGLLWAERNVGADAPEGFGLYFSWGNTDGHEEGSGYDFSSTNYDASPGKQITGDIALSQDAANAYLGGSCRMPTKDEFQELYDNCDSAWVTENGVAGRRFTSKTNGNSIFFPAAGRYNGTTLSDRGSYGYYWSASRNSDSYGCSLYFYSGNVNPQGNSNRRYGFSVRAVQ